MEQSLLQAGKVVSTHGIRGEIKILPWADGPEFLLNFKTLYLDGTPYTVTAARVQKGCVVCHLAGVDDVTAAQTLRNQIVCIDRSEAQLETGAFFIADLIGLPVYEEDGTALGAVREVIPMPAGDVLVVRGEREYQIPNVRAFIREISMENRRITVHLIEGLQTDAN